MVTHSPPTSEVGSSNAGPYVKKLVVAYRLSAEYCTKPWPTLCTGFLCPSRYDLYSVESEVKTQINNKKMLKVK